MILFDTDHISVLRMPASERQSRLLARIAGAGEADESMPARTTNDVMLAPLLMAKPRTPAQTICSVSEAYRPDEPAQRASPPTPFRRCCGAGRDCCRRA